MGGLLIKEKGKGKGKNSGLLIDFPGSVLLLTSDKFNESGFYFPAVTGSQTFSPN